MRDDGLRAAIIRLVVVLLIFCPRAASAQGEAFDDVMQHVPMASAFAMRACGVKSESPTWTEFIATAGVSYLVGTGVTYGLKHTVKEWRPDDSDNRSFPSGHSAFAFAGATVLHKEFGHLSPWISVAGYGVATFTAVDRVCRDRHHWYDACAGAAIGFLSTELTYYVTDRLFPRHNASIAFTGNRIDFALRW